MKVPAYPKYKPSGGEWLGDVPQDWEVKRLKYSASVNDEALPETTRPDFEFSYVDIGSVDSAEGIIAKEKMQFETAPSRARRVVKHGDTIVSTVRTYLRAIAPIRNLDDDLIVSTGFAVIRPRKVRSDFLGYALRESSFVETIVARSVGVSYPAINASEVGTIPIPLPPVDEQRTIADFLDRKTARLDTLVEKKRELIEKLKEKRSALISRTVTRGLPPDAAHAAGLNAHPKLIPSGIEWLGDIPEDWQVLPLTKYLAEKSDYRGKTPEKVSDGVFLVTAKNVRMGWIDYEASQEFVTEEDYDEIMRRGLPKTGDILFTTEAPLGNVALVNREDVALAQRIIRFRVRSTDFVPAFALYGMMADAFQIQLRLLATGSTAEGIKASKLHQLKLVAPRVEEQRAIADYLDQETAKLDRMMEKVEAAIEKLQEYRTALITAAVTGKIDVRTVKP